MDDYKALANSLKDEANVAFQKGDIDQSIALYTQAVEIDPDNHVLYSNRSAAYMKTDSKSKALKDAERCVELAPEWAKGYNRLGVAQQSLKRFDAAMDSFKKGLQLEPSNTTLWSALSACQEAVEKDKSERYSEAAREREVEAQRLRRADEAKQKQEEDYTNQKLSSFLDEIGGSIISALNASSASSSSSVDNKEPDLLSGFFSEIANQPVATRQTKAAQDLSDSQVARKAESKYATQDLGDPISQFNRLTQSNYQWRNLNPFYVLQLGIDATDEDVKLRYKNLSRMVHPDKLRDMENAREAFEQVKTAYQKLMDEKQRSVIVLNIEYILEEFNKERRRLISKGVSGIKYSSNRLLQSYIIEYLLFIAIISFNRLFNYNKYNHVAQRI